MVVSLVVVSVLGVLELGLPDTAESGSWVVSNTGPGGLVAEQLDSGGLGGDGNVIAVEGTGVAEVANTTEVATEDVLSDKSLRGEYWPSC